MQPTGADLLINFLPLVLLSLPLVIGAAYLAPKMGASRTLWVILLLIPIVNIFALYAFGFRWAGAVLDKLNDLGDRSKVF